MTILLIATLAMLTVCVGMLRAADKQIAARDRRINDLYVEMQSIEAQADEWQRVAEKLRADLARQVERRIALDDELAATEGRAAAAGRDAVEARFRANRCKVRAERAEAALKAIARVVAAPPDHPDVGDKILERLANR